MKSFKIIFCILLSGVLREVALQRHLSIARAFISDEIVTDLELRCPPKKPIEIIYPCGKYVNLGNELTPTQVKDMPTVHWNYRPEVYQTLLMTDPDADSRVNPNIAEIRHWLVMNILNDDVANADTIVEYLGSGPRNTTGLHRYIFLIFEQSGRIDTSDITVVTDRMLEGRPFTHTAELIEVYQLSQPKFGNYYQAQYDDYVPILHAQIGNSEYLEQ